VEGGLLPNSILHGHYGVSPATKEIKPMTIDNNEKNRRLIALSERPDVRFWRADYAQLSPPEQVFLVIWELEAQVNNGGFEQYFLNSSGRLASHAAEALRTIGAQEMASITDLAVYAVGRDIPWLDNDARQDALDALDEDVLSELEDLTQAFFKYPNNLTELLYEYVSQHRSEIGAPADF
jgi:hypothetical protein